MKPKDLEARLREAEALLRARPARQAVSDQRYWDWDARVALFLTAERSGAAS